MKCTLLSFIGSLLLMAGMPLFLLSDCNDLLQNRISQAQQQQADSFWENTRALKRHEESKNGTEPVGSSLPATVRLLRHETGEVEEIALETYLYGVVFGEMPASFGEEALRAQAVAARTFTVYRIEQSGHENADLCDDTGCCQNYISYAMACASWGESIADSAFATIRQAVDDTAGQILCYDGKPIMAAYHASSHHVTESSESAWGKAFPYLVSVETPEIVSTAQKTFRQAKMKVLLQKAGCTVTGAPDTWFGKSTVNSGNRVARMQVCDKSLSGTALRNLLGLTSTCFTVSYEDGTFTVTYYGSGHGVGMSQYGAKKYAARGMAYTEILAHYYPGTRLVEP